MRLVLLLTTQILTLLSCTPDQPPPRNAGSLPSDHLVSPTVQVPIKRILPVKTPDLNLPPGFDSPVPQALDETVTEFDRRISVLDSAARNFRARTTTPEEGAPTDESYIIGQIQDLDLMRPFLKPSARTDQVLARYDQLLKSLEDMFAFGGPSHFLYKTMDPELKTNFTTWEKALTDYENTAHIFLAGDYTLQEYLNSLELQTAASSRKVKTLLDQPQIQTHASYTKYQEHFKSLAGRQMAVIKLLEKK